MRIHYKTLLSICIFVVTNSVCGGYAVAQSPSELTEGVKRRSDDYPGRKPIDAYLKMRTEAIESRCLNEVPSADEWKQQRPQLVRQLREMLGLDPWPEKTDLHATIVGRETYDGYAVERLHFQSRPGLYVTANLYLPEDQEGPFPTILYVCGHARVKEGSVSYGNKVGYHHHGIWFARHGYVCMMIDTIQLGEIEGIHHGTYSHDMWWWASRGYTPAGVEAWNSIRALDYLETRPEVDASRFGVTGRSGGGAYSWWTAALDERIKVAVPVAGITDMRNHVIDDCIEGHCDCMFMVNKYGWDFATVAALVAPRPLLIANSHRDGIFPLDGVMRVYFKTLRVYKTLDAIDNLAVHITEGPHKDTQALRVGAFAWFEKHLKGSTSEIEEVARKAHDPKDLQVFVEGLPDDERVTDAHEWFVDTPAQAEPPADAKAWDKMRRTWLERLSSVPGALTPLDRLNITSTHVNQTNAVNDVSFMWLEFNTASPLRLFAISATTDGKAPVQQARLCIGTASEGQVRFTLQGKTFRYDSEARAFAEPKSVADAVKQVDQPVLFVMLQGVGPTRWDESRKETVQLRRRLQLVGESLDAIRVSEIRNLIRWVQNEKTFAFDSDPQILLEASGESAVLAALASINVSNVSLALHQFPSDLRRGPILLGLSKAIDLPRLLTLAIDNAANSTLTVSDHPSPAIDYINAVSDTIEANLTVVHLTER
ncbi:MAG: acetylxylan esterase [Pirellulaceae bacterium]